MRLSGEQVLIVAMIAYQSKAFRAAGKIVAEVPSDAAEADIDVLADEQLGAMLARILCVAGIQMRTAVRSKAVNGVNVRKRGSGTGSREGAQHLPARRRGHGHPPDAASPDRTCRDAILVGDVRAAGPEDCAPRTGFQGA